MITLLKIVVKLPFFESNKTLTNFLQCFYFTFFYLYRTDWHIYILGNKANQGGCCTGMESILKSISNVSSQFIALVNSGFQICIHIPFTRKRTKFETMHTMHWIKDKFTIQACFTKKKMCAFFKPTLRVKLHSECPLASLQKSGKCSGRFTVSNVMNWLPLPWV